MVPRVNAVSPSAMLTAIVCPARRSCSSAAARAVHGAARAAEPLHRSRGREARHHATAAEPAIVTKPTPPRSSPPPSPTPSATSPSPHGWTTRRHSRSASLMPSTENAVGTQRRPRSRSASSICWRAATPGGAGLHRRRTHHVHQAPTDVLGEARLRRRRMRPPRQAARSAAATLTRPTP